MTPTDTPSRKIDLPEYCVAMTGQEIHKGKSDCDHDYPPESMENRTDCVHWTCSRCGCKVCFEVAQ